MGRIQRLSLTSTATGIDLTASGKVLLRVSGGDVRIGLDPVRMTAGEYFTLTDGTSLVLDQPVSLGGELHYFAAVTTATVEVWITDCGVMY